LAPLAPLPPAAPPECWSLREPQVLASSPTRRVLLIGILATCAQPRPASASTEQSGFSKSVADAYAAFTKGEYDKSETLWAKVSEDYPDQSLAWSNLAIVLIINASERMELGKLPTGGALDRLNRALEACERAVDLGLASDPLLLNARGNALGLLQRWEEAHDTYAVAADASPRDFESIPLSNQALTSFELGRVDVAEREASRLVRRDPGFRDGFALLAALKHSRGDNSGAAIAFSTLCSEPQWCERYSTDAVVLGRWTPRAVAAFQSLLREPGIKLVLQSSRDDQLMKVRM
jgi:tetratricopeptide (TPR) repeat protein